MIDLNVISMGVYEPLAQFLEKQSGDSRDLWLNRFQFWWELNPNFNDGWKRGWILKDKNRLVGCIGVIPTLFKADRKYIIAHNSTSWFVEEEYRKHSIKLFMKTVQNCVDSIMFVTTPNDQVIEVLRAFKFETLPNFTARQTKKRVCVYLLNSKKVIGNRLQNSFLRYFNSIIGIGFTLYQDLRFKKRNPPYQLKLIENPCAEFDDLWGKTEDYFEFTNVRSSKQINWLCGGTQSNTNSLFGAFNSKNELVAFVIFKDRIITGIQAVECVDFWAIKEATDAIGDLFIFAIDCFRQEQKDLLLFPHYNETIAWELKKLRLSSTETGILRAYWKNKLSGVEIDASNSFFAGAQGDYVLLNVQH